jgi:hypothetical protein
MTCGISQPQSCALRSGSGPVRNQPRACHQRDTRAFGLCLDLTLGRRAAASPWMCKNFAMRTGTVRSGWTINRQCPLTLPPILDSCQTRYPRRGVTSHPAGQYETIEIIKMRASRWANTSGIGLRAGHEGRSISLGISIMAMAPMQIGIRLNSGKHHAPMIGLGMHSGCQAVNRNVKLCLSPSGRIVALLRGNV